MPKFSIILPVYNIDDKYKRAVESVINQDFEDFELIIVDDASPRKVEVSTFSDQRIRLITRKSNGGGPSLARNTALSIARGEYIAFLDADDYYAKNFLSEMNKHIVCGIDYVTCSFFLKNKEVEEPYRGGILSGVSCTYGWEDTKADITKPPFFEEMVKVVKILAKDFLEVRIDCIAHGEKFYINELTFFPGSGYDIFDPNTIDEQMGEMLQLEG